MFLFVGCDEASADSETTGMATQSETTECETLMFGLTEKEIEAIEDIIKKPYVGGPYTLEDVEKITYRGYEKQLNKDGTFTENPNMLSYFVEFKNGETQIVSINKILLDD